MSDFTVSLSEKDKKKWCVRVCGLSSKEGEIKFQGLFDPNNIPLFYIDSAECNGKFVSEGCRNHGCKGDGVTLKIEKSDSRYGGKNISFCRERDKILAFKNKIQEILSADIESNL